jgi:hypothetical protein
LTGGTLINTGVVLNGVGVINGTIINSGYIDGRGAIGVGNGLIIDSGEIDGGDLPGITADDGLTLVLEPGFDIRGEGDAYVKSGNGTLIVSSGIENLSLYGFRGFSNIDISADTGVTLSANEEWLRLLPSSGTTLAGFQPGDTLQIPVESLPPSAPAPVTFLSPATYVAGEGIILSLATGPVTLGLNMPLTEGFDFTTVSNAKGTYLDITTPCFCAGTRIRTLKGDVPVEALRIGDEVLTAFSGPQRIQWIGRRSYDGRFIAGNMSALPVCLKAGAIADGIPARDLWVSPGHAICEGGVLIHAGRLVNGVSIVQAEAVAQVSYYHLELEGHHILFAEDCPAESFLDAGFRQHFANAHDYEGEGGAVLPCLPLLQSGFHLENIRRRLRERAGIAAHTAPPGPLRGNIDEAGPAQIRGWAQDVFAPETPVILDIVTDGNHLATIIANECRADLHAAGLGSGCHGFSLPCPSGVQRVEICRASDGALLSPARLIQAA